MSDYRSAVGGALKLKGGAGVEKKRKKKKPKPMEGDKDDPAEHDKHSAPAAERDSKDLEPAAEDDVSKGDHALTKEDEKEVRRYVGMTDSERRFDEKRRKRLDERLKREGVKTHKERVEEFNRQLSKQSEHHDMPKIGPG